MCATRMYGRVRAHTFHLSMSSVSQGLSSLLWFEGMVEKGEAGALQVELSTRTPNEGYADGSAEVEEELIETQL